MALKEIEGYIENKSEEEFLQSSLLRFAALKQLEIIGEAANHISDETKTAFANVEWKKMKAARNIYVHEYFAVDFQVVWKIILNDLSLLKDQVHEVLNKL